MEKQPTIVAEYMDESVSKKEEVYGHLITTLNVESTLFQKRKNPSKKQRITVQISEDVIERVKNAVYWTPGLTLASLAEEAFSKAVNVLEEGREAPFPKREEELKTGRPIK